MKCARIYIYIFAVSGTVSSHHIKHNNSYKFSYYRIKIIKLININICCVHYLPLVEQKSKYCICIYLNTLEKVQQ